MRILLYSEHRFDLILAKKRLLARFLAREKEGLIKSFDCESVPLEKIKEALLEEPLFFEKKIIILSNYFKYYPEKPLLQIWPKLSSQTSLIFLEEKKPSPSEKLTLQIKKVNVPLKKELAILKTELLNAGFSFSQTNTILKTLLEDKWFIFNEVAKIELAKAAGVSTKEVLTLPIFSNVFQLAKSWLEGDKKMLSKLLIQLQEKQTEELIGGLVYVLRQLILLIAGGEKEAKKMPSFTLLNRRREVKLREKNWIFSAFLELAELDYLLKTGQIDNTAFFFFLFKTV